MQRMQVPRLRGEHLAIEPVRLREPAGLMVSNGGHEGVGGWHGAFEARIGGQINGSARRAAGSAHFGRIRKVNRSSTTFRRNLAR
jgi:hypothetical protein